MRNTKSDIRNTIKFQLKYKKQHPIQPNETDNNWALSSVLLDELTSNRQPDILIPIKTEILAAKGEHIHPVRHFLPMFTYF